MDADNNSNSNLTPVEITAEDISAGIKEERVVLIESGNPRYNGKSIRVRSLRAREFRKITAKVHVGKDDLHGNFELAFEAAKIGIVTPGIAEKLDDIDPDVILQVGQDILASSEANDKAVEDFSGAQKASSS
jgi:hypothetical protein